MPGYETTYILQEDIKGNVKILYCLSDCLEIVKDYIEREIPFTMSFMSTKTE